MRERIALWKHVYDVDDNAISRALSKMAWDLAAYSCLVEMVRQAPGEEHRKHLNGMLLEMAATGFWSTTLQGVRRLVEKAPIAGPFGVCSLGGLIQDVRATRGRLTRNVFVRDVAGLTYNFEGTKQRRLDYARARHDAGDHGAFFVPRELNYDGAERRHAEFDWLSGTAPGTSRPSDLIRVDVFDALETRLAHLEAVAEHVNVQIAHAATEASRQGRVLERWGLHDAKSALMQLSQVAELVGRWFCFSGIGTVLPVPHYDQFQHLDNPLFSGDVGDLQAVWDGLSQEIGQWHDVDGEEF